MKVLVHHLFGLKQWFFYRQKSSGLSYKYIKRKFPLQEKLPEIDHFFVENSNTGSESKILQGKFATAIPLQLST
jgi:hypothetical protein